MSVEDRYYCWDLLNFLRSFLRAKPPSTVDGPCRCFEYILYTMLFCIHWKRNRNFKYLKLFKEYSHLFHCHFADLNIFTSWELILGHASICFLHKYCNVMRNVDITLLKIQTPLSFVAVLLFTVQRHHYLIALKRTHWLILMGVYFT